MVLNYLQFFSDFTTSLSSEEPKAVSVVEETSKTTEKTPPEEINKEFRSAEEVPLRTSKPEDINTEYRSAEETNSSTKNQLDGIENLQRQGN